MKEELLEELGNQAITFEHRQAAAAQAGGEAHRR